MRGRILRVWNVGVVVSLEMTQASTDLSSKCHLLFAITTNHLTDSERPFSLFGQINRADVTIQTSG
ncbi:protein of unknown function [Sterolibacterium denitrificans]|uniref:Uncharacterized protein n=1 Tax=Sterolibacterium denitrificans TaxID=157592 RepID=A0A7Z7MVN6_9PROT|nr:protein of unknown function [Sterolibacterium denitrificans]